MRKKKIERISQIFFAIENPALICMNDIPLLRVKTHMFLGFNIQENLNWKEHENFVSNKISKAIGILYHLKTFVPENILRIIYCSLILPYLQ